MKIFEKKYSRIRNLPGFRIDADFIFNIFSLILLLAAMSVGLLLLQLTRLSAGDEEIRGIVLAVMAGGLVISVFSLWNILIFMIFAGWIITYLFSGSSSIPVYLIPALSLYLSSSVQLIYHWDKAVILRLGRFRKTKGSGLFFLIPFIDRIAAKVDTRIRVTDFSAERTLTRDNVPVHIDALCFWMIWDAQKAILEVENYIEAVTLSAQTALRDAIGTNDLDELLSERDKVGNKIQQILDKKTSPWGITILSVEFTDIIIPKELEDAMSRKAQAEREHQARVILGDAEIKVARKMKEANSYYADDPQAFQLRSMNMIFDGLRQSKGSIIMVPSSAVEQLGSANQPGSANQLGLAAFQKLNQFENLQNNNTGNETSDINKRSGKE